MSSVAAPGLSNDVVGVESSQSRRGYYASPSRRHGAHHNSSYTDVSYMERPLLQSTPCHRRHYDTCPTEAHWNGRDAAGPRAAVVHRVKTAATTTTTTAPAAAAAAAQPPSAADNDDRPAADAALSSPSCSCFCGSVRFRSQAQMVDVMSRILFPCMFLIFNIVYWPYYLFIAAP